MNTNRKPDVVYEIRDYVDFCQDEILTDEMGGGLYMDGDRITNERAMPSEIAAGKIDPRYGHVAWFFHDDEDEEEED